MMETEKLLKMNREKGYASCKRERLSDSEKERERDGKRKKERDEMVI
jgi:hypothetical protein